MNQIRDLRTIVRNVAAQAAQRNTDRALEKAHRAAADFHDAMAEALEARTEIEDGNTDAFWVARYQAELGRAAIALQSMPVKWAAVLSVELDAVKLPHAAE